MRTALLHRYPKYRIKETNAAFPYLEAKGMDVLTFKKFNRTGSFWKFWKSILWVFYAPLLVLGRGYDVIYCDDSYPFYPALVKLASPKSKVVIRIGDFHLMYYYSGFIYEFLHFFERISWHIVDGIIAISNPMADFIMQRTNTLVSVALDPVNPNDFQGCPSCTYNDGSVMFHGVLTRNKNIDLLLKAATLLPDVDFKIIGDGPDMKRLQKMAPKNVFFQGWVPFKDISYHISHCSIGVALRSDNPGNEYVVTSPFLQYGVMGKPCLVTRRKVFGDYEWQFSSANEMANKIKLLLDRPEEGKNLKEYILENHSAEKIAGEIWEILTSQS